MSSRDIFLTPRGLRAGWRFGIWWAISISATGVISLVLIAIFRPGPHPFLDPVSLIEGDILTAFIPAAIATATMMRFEHRTLRDYYVPSRTSFFGKRLWAGIAWGFLAVSALVGMIAMLGGYSVVGLTAAGPSLLYWAALWIAASLTIGIVEEFTFRAYLLRTLADGIGFWFAAILLSIGFGALHYFTKPYERWEDFASTGLLGLFLCFTIRRTGTLSFAIGWHMAFDWGAMYLYSGRNAGEVAVGRLLQTSWHGSDLLTGGMLGPEASLLVFPIIAALFGAFALVYRRTEAPISSAPGS